ncbi:MAG: FAD-binding oxidoreductase [Planctomycetes bacterium]|nr:FAD-binding oxidoreductase [Planctomycetota bacterium]
MEDAPDDLGEPRRRTDLMWHTPQSVEEAVGLLSACPAETPFLATGAAEPPSPSLPLPPETTVVSTAALRSIVEHRRDDLTVTVRAGARVGDLNAELSAAGQWIPVEPRAADLSVGGLISSAVPGAFDAAFGPVRRQLLALRLVSGGGREYRWGRPVMKNVAGYDVPRLACGSFGRLGLITEATFRLWPLPAVSVQHRVEGRGARRVARALCEGADTTTATPGMRWSWKAARDDRADPRQAADYREHLTLWLLGSERSVLAGQLIAAVDARIANHAGAFLLVLPVGMKQPAEIIQVSGFQAFLDLITQFPGLVQALYRGLVATLCTSLLLL